MKLLIQCKQIMCAIARKYCIRRQKNNATALYIELDANFRVCTLPTYRMHVHVITYAFFLYMCTCTFQN